MRLAALAASPWRAIPPGGQASRPKAWRWVEMSFGKSTACRFLTFDNYGVQPGAAGRGPAKVNAHGGPPAWLSTAAPPGLRQAQTGRGGVSVLQPLPAVSFRFQGLDGVFLSEP